MQVVSEPAEAEILNEPSPESQKVDNACKIEAVTEVQENLKPEVGLDPQVEEPTELMPMPVQQDSDAFNAAVGFITKNVSKAIADDKNQPDE